MSPELLPFAATVVQHVEATSAIARGLRQQARRGLEPPELLAGSEAIEATRAALRLPMLGGPWKSPPGGMVRQRLVLVTDAQGHVELDERGPLAIAVETSDGRIGVQLNLNSQEPEPEELTSLGEAAAWLDAQLQGQGVALLDAMPEARFDLDPPPAQGPLVEVPPPPPEPPPPAPDPLDIPPAEPAATEETP